MSFSPENSAVQVDAELLKALETAFTPDAISQACHAAELRQGLITPDSLNPTVFHATAKSYDAPRSVSKQVVINGEPHFLQAADAAGLLRAESELMKSLFQPAEQARDERGRFTQSPEQKAAADQAAAAQAAKEQLLSTQLAAGLITMQQYLEQSGAVERYVQNKENREIVSGWQAAAEQFVKMPEGQNWPGESRLPEIMDLLIENHLEDSPSAEVLAQAWAYLQQQDYAKAVSEKVMNAKSSQELEDAIYMRNQNNQNNIWNR